MSNSIPYIRIFIDSPGDVYAERQIVMDVINQTQYMPVFRDKVAFRIVSWDQPNVVMRASTTPAEAIGQGLPKPSDCDIVIILLWSRLGTPFTHTDGKSYESFIHWSLINALSSPRSKDHTLIYQRTEKRLFSSEEREGLEQYQRLQEFFESDLLADNTSKVIQYDKLNAFWKMFQLHFTELVSEFLEKSDEIYVGQESDSIIQHSQSDDIMVDYIPLIRVFISSPRDVIDDRQIALEVIERLPESHVFRDKVAFRIVTWDKPGAGTSMRTSMTPKEAISRGLPKPSDCDIVIVLFWSQLGTPFIHTDDIQYKSVAHWVIVDALKGDRSRDNIILYRHTAQRFFSSEEHKEIEQYQYLQEFFESDLFIDDTGQILRGVNYYNDSKAFRRVFELHFADLVSEFLEKYDGSSVEQEGISVIQLEESRQQLNMPNHIVTISPIWKTDTSDHYQADIFMLMPFIDEFRDTYDHIAEAITTERGLSIKRADDLFTKNTVMDDIWNGIYASRLVIAECTGKNPNVFYELGIAHTIGKPAILITRNKDDIPFDIGQWRYISYQDTPRGMNQLMPEILRAIDGVHVEDDDETSTHDVSQVSPIWGFPSDNHQYKSDVFMVMPFRKELKPIYDDHIKTVVMSHDLTIQRGDDFFTQTSIMGDIWGAIYHAKCIIADLTDRNVNVFYELAIAHTLGKKVIMITQKQEDMPYDLRHLRYIEYDYTTAGMRAFEKQLHEALAGLGL